MKQIPCLLIAGPTACGKSSLAEALAQQLGGEIINGDVQQMYAPLSIGTAKPNWKASPIKHHLFDTITTPHNFSVANWAAMVCESVARIRSQGKVPIVVGGSHFYLLSLFFPPRDTEAALPLPECCSSARTHDLTSPCDRTQPCKKEHHVFWGHLARLDPVRAQALHPHDHYRIERALQLCHSGVLASSARPLFAPLIENLHLIILDRDRSELYATINARVLNMLQQGWHDEAVSLSPEWQAFARARNIIGYPELLDSSADVAPSTVAQIQQHTRQYAKRQITFLRSFKKKLIDVGFDNIRECDLTLKTIDLYLGEIVTWYHKYIDTSL